MLLARGIPSSASNDLLSKLKVFLADNIFGLLSIRLCKLLFFTNSTFFFVYLLKNCKKAEQGIDTACNIRYILYIELYRML